MTDQGLSGVRRWATAMRRRPLALAFVVVGVVALVSIGMWSRGHPGGGWEKPRAEESSRSAPNVVLVDADTQRQIGLKVEQVQLKATVQHIRATGVVGPNETRVARIRPLARGVIQKVYVRAGDRVRPGQPLVAYDNIELGEIVAEHRSAVAALEKAKAEADVTTRALERAQSLIELGAMSKAEYERRRADEANARAGVNSQQAVIASLERKLQRFGVSAADLARGTAADSGGAWSLSSQALLRAPFGGVVIAAQVAEGESVDPQSELFTVADLSTVWIQGDVYEKDIALMIEEQDVKVHTDAYPGETFVGKLTYVSDALDPSTRTAKVRCEVANPGGRLKLEMFATIEIPTSRRREALVIPVAAVQQLDNRSIVFVKTGDGEFRARDVQLGAESDGQVEVAAGLAAGESVVVQGALMLKSKLKIGELGEHEGEQGESR